MMSGFRKGWARIVAGLAAFTLVACAAPRGDAPAAAATMRPAMWTLSDEDTTIYLFGTIHALPEGVEWRTPLLDQALASADELVLELAIQGNEMAIGATMMRMGIGTDLPPLIERVPEAQRPALREAMAAAGILAPFLDRMKTWAAAVNLMYPLFMRAGIDPANGVEQQLIRTFAATGRPQIGLEAAEEQFGIFDRMAEEDQRAFLVSLLEPSEDIRRQFDAMLDAWRRGDLAAVSRTFDDEANISPEMREQLLTRRNARWAEWLERRLERPGTSFVAVGAGHLAGRDSVQEMLRARGLNTRRVQ